MRSVIIFAALAMIAGIMAPRYLTQMRGGRPAPIVMSARPDAPSAATPARGRSVVVPRDAYGHFRVDGRVDGRHLQFMIDTGASVVALTAEDAATLGIHPSAHDFTVPVRTANGTVSGAPVELGLVEIGDVTVRNVAALVLPDGALGENLLGLSFLSRLHFEYGDGRLVLEQ